jgi:hypothetical protein
VADPGDSIVVVGRGHLDRAGPAGERQRRDAIPGRAVVAAARNDDPWPAVEEIRARATESGDLSAGHRVAADESQSDVAGPSDDRALRARDVGDDRIGREGRAERPGERFKELQAGERRRGQEDEARIAKRLGRPCGVLVHDPEIPRSSGTRP